MIGGKGFIVSFFGQIVVILMLNQRFLSRSFVIVVDQGAAINIDPWPARPTLGQLVRWNRRWLAGERGRGID